MENKDPYEELEIYLKQINNEISEVFEKLQDVDDVTTQEEENGVEGSPLETSTETDSVIPIIPNSTKRKKTSSNFEEWSSLSQFENLIKIEIENLAAENHRESSSMSSNSAENGNNVYSNNYLLKPEKHVTIPLESFSNKTQCIANINKSRERKKTPNGPQLSTDSKPEKHLKRAEREIGSAKNSNETAKTKDQWSSDDSILKSIDEDNKSTTSTISSSSAFEDSTNLYSEKSESSMSSVNNRGKLNDDSELSLPNTYANENGADLDVNESLEVLSHYDNDSGNDDFDEKDDHFNSQIYSSTDSRNDKKLPKYFNSLPLIRIKKKDEPLGSKSSKWKQFYQPTIEPELFHDDMKTMNFWNTSSSYGSSDFNILLHRLNCAKSSSVPTLDRKNQCHEDCTKLTVLRNSRSQSDHHLCEIQAEEAMKWLKEAGFPQYAQMYQDLQFPIDLSCVERDHPFLMKDQLQSLYRRLLILNRSASMRVDGQHNRKDNTHGDESDEDICALSNNWTFQPEIRRWSRVGEMGPLSLNLPREGLNTTSRDSTPEKSDVSLPHANLVDTKYLSMPSDCAHDTAAVGLKRSGSERIRERAKNILRRVESIKSKRKKKKNREGVVVSAPLKLDVTQLHQKFNNMSLKDIKQARSTSTSPLHMSPVSNTPNPLIFFADPKICPATEAHASLFGQHLSPYGRGYPVTQTSPLHFYSQKKQNDDSSSYCSEISQDSSNGSAEKKLSPVRRFFQNATKPEELGTLSDSEAIDRAHQQKKSSKNRKYNTLTREGRGSLNLGNDSSSHKESLKAKKLFRSRSAVRHSNLEGESQGPKSGSVQRWHSFRAQTSTKHDFGDVEGISLCRLSCGQMDKLRKLGLVTLTGYIERYCPTHRTGWNWELPKFIKKIKTPEYKDKKVFGVPFRLILQKTGQTLPKGIQAALNWLRINALDQTGIFRKSGVKSRITKLKLAIEQTEDSNLIKIFENQQAYDVADVVKQYFRELPESLLTTKLSDTFVMIFQFLPNEVKFEALQSAILLLPDEHREVLMMLLDFLSQVADQSEHNQMSASNLGLCLAPSIFQNGVHSNTPAASPRRKKVTGQPDAKDLDENRAATQCLTYLIQNYKRIYHIPSIKIKRCNFSYMEESRPVTLEALGDAVKLSNWRSFLYECVKATIKEGREKSRGWISINSFDSNTEIYYRKVGDGHPLKLWKCVTEVEASPVAVLTRITKERHIWDKQLLKMRVIEELDSQSDIFQYSCNSGHIVNDYCVLRTSSVDLPKGACVAIEISIEHPSATLQTNSVRGVVLASRFLIEPCGNGRSKIMHLSRVDTKGRTVEWYRNYGHICALNLGRIRDGLKNESVN